MTSLGYSIRLKPFKSLGYLLSMNQSEECLLMPQKGATATSLTLGNYDIHLWRTEILLAPHGTPTWFPIRLRAHEFCLSLSVKFSSSVMIEITKSRSDAIVSHRGQLPFPQICYWRSEFCRLTTFTWQKNCRVQVTPYAPNGGGECVTFCF